MEGKSLIESKERKKYRILIADDQPSIIKLLSVLFADDYIIDTAQNGSELITKFVQERPDLVISDNDMGPGVKGTDVLKLIKEKDPETKIIILSGDDIEKEVLELGGVFVSKPPSIKDLKKQVKEMLEETE